MSSNNEQYRRGTYIFLICVSFKHVDYCMRILVGNVDLWIHMCVWPEREPLNSSNLKGLEIYDATMTFKISFR